MDTCVLCNAQGRDRDRESETRDLLSSLINIASALQILLDAGTNINRGYSYGWTALHRAVFDKSLELVEVI